MCRVVVPFHRRFICFDTPALTAHHDGQPDIGEGRDVRHLLEHELDVWNRLVQGLPLVAAYDCLLCLVGVLPCWSWLCTDGVNIEPHGNDKAACVLPEVPSLYIVEK